jgi:hypothetical protein
MYRKIRRWKYIYNYMYTYWRCYVLNLMLHTDQILPKLPAQRKRLGRPVLEEWVVKEREREREGKGVPVLNWAPRHEEALGEWRYRSRHSWPLHYMGVSGQLHDPTDLPQSRSAHGGEEKNSQPLPGLKLPIIQPVAQSYTTELSRLKRNTSWTSKG